MFYLFQQIFLSYYLIKFGFHFIGKKDLWNEFDLPQYCFQILPCDYDLMVAQNDTRFFFAYGERRFLGFTRGVIRNQDKITFYQ